MINKITFELIRACKKELQIKLKISMIKIYWVSKCQKIKLYFSKNSQMKKKTIYVDTEIESWSEMF